MANVDTDKLKQLLYAMIETLDGSETSEEKNTQNINQQNQSSVNTNKKSRYGGGENLFLSMPEKDMHKSDIAIDKLLSPGQLTSRNRPSTEVDVRCRVCGKEQKVSSSLIIDGVHRYKCNDCSRSSG